MANNARGHVVPAPSDTSVTRQTIFETFGNSIRDVVGVANTTARAQLVSDLTAAGEGPSTAKPLLVHRADTDGLHRTEVTVDGSVWTPLSGVLRFANATDRNSWTTSNSGYLITGDECLVAGNRWEWTGTQWRLQNALLVGLDKGDTVTVPGGWRALNTAAGVGTNGANDGYTYGTDDIDVPYPNSFYEISATVAIPTAASGTTRGVQIQGSSGYIIDQMQRATVTAGEIRMSVAGIVRVGSSFTIAVYHDSGANRTVSLKHVSARYVRPA